MWSSVVVAPVFVVAKVQHVDQDGNGMPKVVGILTGFNVFADRRPPVAAFHGTILTSSLVLYIGHFNHRHSPHRSLSLPKAAAQITWLHSRVFASVQWRLRWPRRSPSPIALARNAVKPFTLGPRATTAAGRRKRRQ